MKAKWLLLCFIIALWIAGTIGVAMQVYQTAPPPGSTPFVETFKAVLLLLGGLGVVLPTYLNVWQSIENNQVVQQRLRFDKVNNSFDLIRKWDDPSLLAARKFTRELKVKRNNLSDNALLSEIDGSGELKQSVVLVFNYFEQIRVSVIYDRVDEKILKESLRDIFIDLYERFLPWVKTHTKAYQDDMKMLYKRWQDLMNLDSLSLAPSEGGAQVVDSSVFNAPSPRIVVISLRLPACGRHGRLLVLRRCFQLVWSRGLRLTAC